MKFIIMPRGDYENVILANKSALQSSFEEATGWTVLGEIHWVSAEYGEFEYSDTFGDVWPGVCSSVDDFNAIMQDEE